MRKALVTCMFAGVFGFVLTAAEKPPMAYSKAMKDIGMAAMGLDKAVADNDYDTVSKSAAVMVDAFAAVEKYWTGKADDAEKLAHAAGKAAGDLRAMADIKSGEGIGIAVKDLTATCAQCHMAHREALPDGTFEIK
jgi:hypothetical protein